MGHSTCSLACVLQPARHSKACNPHLIARSNSRAPLLSSAAAARGGAQQLSRRRLSLLPPLLGPGAGVVPPRVKAIGVSRAGGGVPPGWQVCLLVGRVGAVHLVGRQAGGKGGARA